jgi:hypothetical protein
MTGRVFGLKYVYAFLNEAGLLGDTAFSKMLEIAGAMEHLYERLICEKLWIMDFVLSWPALQAQDPDQEKIWRSTFALYEDAFEQELDAYLERRLQAFPGLPKIVDDLNHLPDDEELPY